MKQKKVLRERKIRIISSLSMSGIKNGVSNSKQHKWVVIPGALRGVTGGLKSREIQTIGFETP